jgi:GNAT superfamily N-acetyltransferase
VPVTLQTGASLVHRTTQEPSRARRASWVAVADDELIAYASAHFFWYGGEVGNGRIWVGVRPDWRGEGIGSALWDICAAHLAGAERLTVEIDDDPAGFRFVERRGFTRYDAEVMSRVVPTEANLACEPIEGFRVVPLADIRHRDGDLYEFYGAAGGLRPGDPENRVTFDDWRPFILGNPLLDFEGSFVVLDEKGGVAALSWLLVDHPRRRTENEWTATLPELRGRGLARLAKVAAIRWAAKRGLTEILTGNDPDNEPMRNLNRSLGYRELYTRLDLERRQTISGMPDTDEV